MRSVLRAALISDNFRIFGQEVVTTPHHKIGSIPYPHLYVHYQCNSPSFSGCPLHYSSQLRSQMVPLVSNLSSTHHCHLWVHASSDRKQINLVSPGVSPRRPFRQKVPRGTTGGPRDSTLDDSRVKINPCFTRSFTETTFQTELFTGCPREPPGDPRVRFALSERGIR